MQKNSKARSRQSILIKCVKNYWIKIVKSIQYFISIWIRLIASSKSDLLKVTEMIGLAGAEVSSYQQVQVDITGKMHLLWAPIKK